MNPTKANSVYVNTDGVNHYIEDVKGEGRRHADGGSVSHF